MRARARTKQERFKWKSEPLHDYVLLAVNTGLRPDEAWRLDLKESRPIT